MRIGKTGATVRLKRGKRTQQLHNKEGRTEGRETDNKVDRKNRQNSEEKQTKVIKDATVRRNQTQQIRQ